MQARVKWVEDLTFMAESPSGHTVLLSAGKENGGKDNCLRPLELLLLGLGGCASIDVVSILKKARQDISDCEAIVSAERFDGSPSYYTTINCHFVVAGNNLSDKQVKRAVDLSFEKYCSVSFMLREKADVTWSYEIKQG
ncbi:MAG: putative redox protein [Enterobacterales bacterium]|jgi:putative redox protein